VNDRLSFQLIFTLFVSIFLRQSSGAQICFEPQVNYPLTNYAGAICCADFNGDGKTDLAVKDQLTDIVTIVLGTGTGTFVAESAFPVGGGPMQIISADFNGDGKADLATANYDLGTVSILLGDGTGNFGAFTNFVIAPGSNWTGVATADFNTDSFADLVFSWAGGCGPYLVFGNGDGTFGSYSSVCTFAPPNSITCADFNSDGHADIAVGNGNTSAVSILLGDGLGSFGTSANFGPDVDDAYSIMSADLNNDGKLDLVTANYYKDSISVLLGTGSGNFGVATNFPVGDQPTSVVSADFDNDGNLDLAVANNLSDNVIILAGDGTGSFVFEKNIAVGNWPESLCTSDFNGDGKLDLAVGHEVISILINAPLVISSTLPGTICGSGSTNLEATATAGTIGWFDVITDGTALETGPVYTTPTLFSSATYYVETTMIGCDTLPRTAINVIVNDTFNLTQNITILNSGDSVQVGNSYHKNSGVYIDTLYTINGCDSIITTTLTVQGASNLYAFSPNNDGVNDLWFIDGLENYLENEVIIYNRWGDLIIKFDNYNNDNIIWDGKSTFGKDLAEGTYFFTISANGETNQSGWVQIVR